MKAKKAKKTQYIFTNMQASNRAYFRARQLCTLPRSVYYAKARPYKAPKSSALMSIYEALSGCKKLDIAVNDYNWLKTAVNGFKWINLTENG